MTKTPRCLLTPFDERDLNSFLELQAHPELRKYLGGPIDVAAARRKFTELLSASSPTHHWAVRIRGHEFTGYLSLTPHHDGEDIELSYQLHPTFWGQGFAFESARAVLDFAFANLKLRRVLAETQASNESSIRLLNKLGMLPLRCVTRFGAKQIIYSTVERA